MLITVIITTYNHGPYIEKCINSILEQTIHEKMHIVWVDDCSTDNTIQIGESVIQSYGFKNIDRIHYKTNRFQRGSPKRLDTWEKLKGEFLAGIDGDDYLISASKYATQIELMKKNPKVGISFTRSQEVNVDGIPTGKLWGDLGDKAGLVSFGNVIRGDGGLMPTASMVLRKAQLDDAPRWFWELQPVGDYMYQVLGASPNGALYIPDVSVAYRRSTPNSWTQRYENDSAFKKTFHKDFIQLLLKMRESFGPETYKDFDVILKSHLRSLTRAIESPSEKLEFIGLIVSHPVLYELWAQPA